MAAGEFTEEQHDYQDRVLANANHLLELINDVLDISKIEAGRMELVEKAFNLQQWLDDVAAQMRVLAEEKGLEFFVSMDMRMPEYIQAEPARIRQVAINDVGIPSHLQETIFEEFRQLDSSSRCKVGGTGLGLSIVPKLALMMGGNIRVKSQVGSGSIFTVILPLTPADAPVVIPSKEV
jgi:signal transduction histidine kinase